MYTASFTDDSTFLNDLLSAKNPIDTFKAFSFLLELKANFSKCEIAGLGSLKGVLEAACILKSINLTTDNIKIVGVNFSYNVTLKVQNNFLDTVKSIQQVLCFWNSRMLSLDGKIITFKTPVTSKIVYFTFLNVIPKSSIEELLKIQKTFQRFKKSKKNPMALLKSKN